MHQLNIHFLIINFIIVIPLAVTRSIHSATRVSPSNLMKGFLRVLRSVDHVLCVENRKVFGNK